MRDEGIMKEVGIEENINERFSPSPSSLIYRDDD